jgi:hypothetical protein
MMPMRRQTLFLLCFLFSAVVLSLYARQYFSLEEIYPWGDDATDMLLANKIQSDGYLLTGQYSRFGFNHPGPFFFYITYITEKIFSKFIPNTYGTWVFGLILLNSFFLAISSVLIFVQYDINSYLIIFKNLLFVSIACFFFKDIAISTWPPNKIVIPFLAFLATLPLISERKFSYLPLSILLASIIFHGRVDSPIFTIPILIFAFIIGFFRCKKKITTEEYRQLVYSSAVGILFLAPLLIDFFINSPSNLEYILKSTTQLKSSSSSMDDVVVFFMSYWNKNFNILLYIFTAFVYVFFFPGYQPYFLNQYRNIFLFSLTITIIGLLYFKRTPPPLYEYMARFYLTVPFLILFLPILNLFTIKDKTERSHILRYFFIIPSTLFCTILVFNITKNDATAAQYLHIKELSEDIKELVVNEESIRIGFDQINIDTFADSAGIIYNLNKQGYNICSTVKELKFQFTEKHICSEGEFPNIELVRKETCINQCDKISGKWGLVFTDLSEMMIKLHEKNPFNSNKVIFNSWSHPERDFRWSLNQKASIILRAHPSIKDAKKIDFRIGTLDSQRIIIKFNGILIGKETLDAWDTQISFILSPKIISFDSNNTITFELPDAKTPNNGDPRVLAIALREFSLH